MTKKVPLASHGTLLNPCLSTLWHFVFHCSKCFNDQTKQNMYKSAQGIGTAIQNQPYCPPCLV